MEFAEIKIPGADAIRLLDQHRSSYRTTGLYPFLIGDAEDLRRIKEAAECNGRDPDAIIRASLDIETSHWIEARRKENEEYNLPFDEILGEWPGNVPQNGSIGLHKDVLTGIIKSEVFLGLVRISEPWHLPAILKYGAWNACPEPEVHCAFHRQWHERFGAEITGMSGDVVECAVRNPPVNREGATMLAWDQYWYCNDIIEQGCGSVSNLAGTLMNSPYWYFWWD